MDDDALTHYALNDIGLTGLALSDPETLARLQQKFGQVVELFILARCRGRIRASIVPVLEQSLGRLGMSLGVDFDALAAEAAKGCEEDRHENKAGKGAGGKGKGAGDKHTAKVAPDSAREAPTREGGAGELPLAPGVYGIDTALPWDVYVMRTRARYIEGMTGASEGRLRLMEKTAPNIAPAERARLKRYQRGALTPEEETSLAGEQKRQYVERHGILSWGERQTRIRELEKIAEEEESRNEQFYPTPQNIIVRYILRNLTLKPGMRILEPSAGRGNIVGVIEEACPKCRIDVAEINAVRRELLELKGYRVIGSDFWELGVASRSGNERPVLGAQYVERYDVVAMNPPFDKGVGMAHVKRAWEFLRPGGQLVAILPERNVNGTSRESISFREWAQKHGAKKVISIPAKEFNDESRANVKRSILLPLAVLVMKKPETMPQREKGDGGDYRIAMKELQKPAAPAVKSIEADPVDTGFVPPRILIANEALTKRASQNVIPAQYAALPFMQPHVIEGANLAIESLDGIGGFLLADGTGVGKTIQCLLVAEHYWRTTGEPVLIITADDRVMETAFFEDARKLGFETPEAAAVLPQSVPRRPKNYAGLYDSFADAPVRVWRHSFSTPLRPGINIATYHMLSQYREGGDLLVSVDAAKKERQAAEKEYAAARRDALDELDRMFPKNSAGRRSGGGYKEAKEQRLRELSLYYNRDHPVHVRLREAQDAYTAFLADSVRSFAENTPLVILDEAHRLKNAGDGSGSSETGSRRALLGMAIINHCPRVMYVTATPADRPTDILYLKKAGLFVDDSQFARLMRDLNYVWEAAVTNKDGILIRHAGWRARTPRGSIDHMRRAVAAMAGAFDMLTEDGHMLRREIELTNLTVTFHRFEAPSAAIDTLERVQAAYTHTDDRGREFEDVVSIFSRQMEELEPYKLPTAVGLIDDAMQHGRQVIVFVHTAEEGSEPRKATGGVKPGAVRILKDVLTKRYGEDAVGVIAGASGEYETYRRLENVRQFQSGERRILIGTITSGGTGLSLDDTRGTNPRDVIIVTPPLSYIHVMQAIGRVVRANTKSRAQVHFIFTSNTGIDTWLSAILATKFLSLSAIIKGESRRLNTDSMHQLEETGAIGTASLVAENTMTGDEERTVRHSRLTISNQRVEGWTLPSALPYYAELSGTDSRALVALGGRTPEDLRTFIAGNADWIKKWGLTVNPDQEYARYHGSYLGRVFYLRERRDYLDTWEAVLNAVEFEVLSIPTFTESPYHAGDPVRFMQDIPRSGIARGTTGRIARERKPRITGDQWLYDVEVAGKDVAKAIEYYKLERTDIPTSPYRPGMRWKGVEDSVHGPRNIYFTIIRADGVSVFYYEHHSPHGRDKHIAPSAMPEEWWTQMIAREGFERIEDEGSEKVAPKPEAPTTKGRRFSDSAASSLSDAQDDIRSRTRQAVARKAMWRIKGARGASHDHQDADRTTGDALQGTTPVSGTTGVSR